MKRTVSSIKINDSLTRYRVRIEDVSSEYGTMQSKIRQKTFIRELIENEGILTCGPADFQKLNIFHNGSCWVAEAEAETETLNVNS